MSGILKGSEFRAESLEYLMFGVAIVGGVQPQSPTPQALKPSSHDYT